MKDFFKIIVLLVSINLFSQDFECCKNINDVKKAIQGDWKLKGGNENLIYRFLFDTNKGLIEVLEELNLPPKAEKTIRKELVFDDRTIVNIKSKKGVFFIELVYLHTTVSQKILELNEDHFIYGKGESQHIFIKDKS
jgi:hypothetical protein